MLKPDAIQRTLVGDIIQRFEQVGLKIVALKMIQAETATIEKHYTIDPEWKRKVGEKAMESMEAQGKKATEKAEEMGERVLEGLKKYMTAGPVIIAVLEGAYAVPLVRKLVGGTEPFTSDVGTIRGDYVLDSYALADSTGRSIRNLVHASSSTGEAEKEIAIWFCDDDFVKYKTVHEHILYDVNLDNAKE